MPIGIVLIRLSDLIGYDVIAKHPNDLKIPRKIIGFTSTAHILTKDSEREIIYIPIDDFLTMSYFTGGKSRYLIILMLTLQEDPELYDNKLMDCIPPILKYNDYETLQVVISDLYMKFFS